MAERKHITLIYKYDDNWIGGTYYILNIIKALTYLEDLNIPKLTIVHDAATSINEIKAINYPYIDFVGMSFNYNKIETIINKIARLFKGTYAFKKTIPVKNIENLYPVGDNINVNNVNQYYYWIPDFQEYHLPHFFTKREINSRQRSQKFINRSNTPVVFSSYNALNDYDHIYKNNHNKKRVLQFVSILDQKFKEISIDSLREKFGVSKPYFIVCNQFWRHKNHEIILKAAKLLKEQNADFQILLTGKEHDYRDPNYIVNIKKFVKDNSLNDTIFFLGFIDRNEQLQLMNNSVAIIQPSLFEGWSTVVEDAKVLNKFILVSDIPLHREQIDRNNLFFDPANADDLKSKMKAVLEETPKIENTKYDDNIINFARKFISLFD